MITGIGIFFYSLFMIGLNIIVYIVLPIFIMWYVFHITGIYILSFLGYYNSPIEKY